MAKTTAFSGSLQFCSTNALWSFRKELAECLNREGQIAANYAYYLGLEQERVARGEIPLSQSRVAEYEQAVEVHTKAERMYRARANKVRRALEFRRSIGLA